MLVGLVTKNAILIVEYATRRRRAAGERGERDDPVEAVIAAARIRLRPILMTTLATVFGVMPIALGLGAGAEARKPLGAAVVGGMLFSTLLTLVVVPVVYTLLARFAGEPARAGERRKAEVAPPALVPETAEPVCAPASQGRDEGAAVLIGSQLSHYRLLEKLGEGGMGA